MTANNTNFSDINFIGSGISTSYSLLHFLDLLESNERLSKKVEISIIEKYEEFNLGIPYGVRSGFSTLLITSLESFLVQPELDLFISWLNKNKEWLLKEFEKEGGILSKQWLTKHAKNIAANQWKKIFIPRRFFGCYLNERVHNRIEQLQQEGKVNVKYIQGEVIDVDRKETNYEISLDSGAKLQSKQLVVSVGSLPKRYFWKEQDLIEAENLLFVNNPYKPRLNIVLNTINKFIQARENKKTNILIVGSNASGLELLYKINDIAKAHQNNVHFTFLSTLGQAPDAVVDHDKLLQYETKNLTTLASEDHLNAKAIYDAAMKDLDVAEAIDLGAASTVGVLSKGMWALIDKLSPEEQLEFACCYGNDIGRRQRCAGQHYLDVVEDLKSQNRLNHIAGRFNDLISEDTKGNYKLSYLDTATKEARLHDNNFHVVINSVGSITFEQEGVGVLLVNLIQKKYATPNKSQIGFAVNEKLEASENLYVVGPLAAGNVINGKPIWHVEHCGRIIMLSGILANSLFDNLKNESAL